MEKFDKEYKTDFGYLRGYTTLYGNGQHPFVVGSRHVEYASDHNGGILDASVTNQIPCDHCKKPYSDEVHSGHKSAVVILTRDTQEKELAEWLSSIKPDMEAAKIDGYAFGNTTQFHIMRGDKVLI